MYRFVIFSAIVCYASAGVISVDNGWDNKWDNGWNNGWNNDWENKWDNGWNKGWEVAPKIVAAPTIVKTVAAPTIVKTVALKSGATSYANSNLWSVNPVPVSIPVVHKVATPVITKIATPVITKVATPVVVEKSWGGLDDGWSPKW